MYYEKEIKTAMTEIDRIEEVIASVKAEQDVLEIKLSKNRINNYDYKRLNATSKQIRKMEARAKSLHRSLSEYKHLRSQKFKRDNVEKSNSKDRVFASVAYNVLPKEVLAAIEEEVAKRVEKHEQI